MGAFGKLFGVGTGKRPCLAVLVAVCLLLTSAFIERGDAKKNGSEDGNGGKQATFGQAMSKQKKGDWEGAIAVYNALIEDLWATHPESILLPKSYMGRAYCALQVGDGDLAYQSWKDLWTTGAWANPNLPQSPEFEAYRLMVEENYAGAIRSFVSIINHLPEGTKKRQEAQMSLALCHTLIGTDKHYREARRLLEQVIDEAGDQRITAFAHWLNGLTLVAYLDLIAAQASFDAALATDPNLDPSVAAMEILDDQLSPSVNVKKSLGQSGVDLLQLAEDYANASYLTLSARLLEQEGNVEDAQSLYNQAEALLGQENVASQTFLNQLLP